ncbi:MAG: tetratricopeptide repeat protein [Xanthomonadaceae bacterium]|nr:tetratricopeptide repeat protein [Xanthomonadaceae bacterium]
MAGSSGQLSTERMTGPELWEAAQKQVLQGHTDAARASLEALLAKHPGQVGARMLLAAVILEKGKVRGATEQMKLAAAGLSQDEMLVARVAQGLSRLGEINAARACLMHPAVARTRSGPALTAIGHVYQGLGLQMQALQLMDRARATGYDNPDFRYFRALQLQFNGNLEQAEIEMESCLRLGPTFGRASLSLARIRRQTAASNHVDFIRSRLSAVPKGSEDHAAFEFALYKELEDLGQLDEAWAALERGNAVMASRLPYDPAAEEALFDDIIRRFDTDFLSRPAQQPEGPTPIFIVGMPRSGTTLLERILGNHSMVRSAGELSDLPRQLRWVADRHGHPPLDHALLRDVPSLDFALLGRRYLEQSQWRAEGRPFYVDKLPPNFMLVGCIRRALPHAKVIHMTRDPMDLCFSNYRAMFGDAYGYSYDIARLAHHHAQYTRLMTHWRETMPEFILDLPYADLVTRTEETCSRLFDFCGLSAEAGGLDHTSNETSVATLSSAQVRQPIHARGLGEWRRFERQLQPLSGLLSPSAGS